MSLEPGVRLGPYEVHAPIGAGGMGEVYKATDTRLDRTVAIKVLPEHLAESPERRARFDREAKAISQLNHPHICTLHDVGAQDGVDFIVMEHIEGETLAERLKKGLLTLADALTYGAQIADGLDAAHRAGIVHRDLKPANVMLTSSGVKLLDFGLVRLVEADADAEASDDAPTRQKDLTQEESIVGTLQYMAPEQLEHKSIDARTDIFAFGVVLFEMVTGRRAFEGETQASLITAIMSAPVPALASLRIASPESLDHVVQRCVAKEPAARWQSISDVRHELEWVASRPSNVASADAPAKNVGVLAAGAILAAGLAGGLVLSSFFTTEPERDVAAKRLSIGLSHHGDLYTDSVQFPTIAADGSSVAYIHRVRGGREHAYVRSLSDRLAQEVPAAEGAEDLFLSPDGEWLGFNANERLQKVPVSGGLPVVLAETGHIQGAVWGSDESIIFGRVGGGLARVSENGGTPEAVTELEPGEVGHWWPQLVPGSDWILFTVWRGSTPEAYIESVSTRTGVRQRLSETGVVPAYVPSGHLVYWVDNSLMVAPFDPERGTTLAPARSVEEQVRWFAVASSNGTLLYTPSTNHTSLGAFLVEADRSGSVVRRLEEARLEYPRTIRLAPNGRSLAIADGPDNDGDIWVYDLEGRPPSPLFYTGHNLRPVWSPDGDRIVFGSTSHARGGMGLVSMPSDGSASEPEPVDESYDSIAVQQAWGWTPRWQGDHLQ